MSRVHRRVLRHAKLKLYAVNACLVVLAGTCTVKVVWGNKTIKVIGTTYAAQQMETEAVEEVRQFAITPMEHSGETVVETERVMETKEVTETETETEAIEETEAQTVMGMVLSEEDEAELLQITMAESEGEPVEGKADVILVVLNRCVSGAFPNTIHEVIFQPGQFTPVSDGRYYSVVPNDECREALDMVLDGWNESQGALYFASTDYSHPWHSNCLEYLFTEGKHEFFK